MRKIWLIAEQTYVLGVRSGTFLMLTFGLPLLMVAPIAIIELQSRANTLPTVGYVDQSRQLSSLGEVQRDGEVLRLEPYPDVAAAGSALTEGSIDAYVVVPEGYLAGDAVRYYGKDDPRGKIRDALAAFLRHGLLPDAPAKTVDLLENPVANLILVASDSGAIVRDGFASMARTLIPFALAGVFGFLVTTNIGQMGVAVVREKDQRALEIILTSLPAWQLVTGKILGITLVSLTQIAVWTIGGSLALALAVARWAPGESIVVPFDVVGWALALFLPGYFLYAVLAAGAGLMAGNVRQARQAAGAFGMVAMSPFILIVPVMDAPNGPLAVGLSLFPLTAPMVAVLRLGLTTVATWQLLLSFVLALLALLGSICLVTRLFRTVILLYGQPLRPRTLLWALRVGAGGGIR